MRRESSERITITWSAKARAFVARSSARRAELARGATLAEAARKLAEAAEPKDPLLSAMRKVHEQVRRSGIKPPTMREINAEIRAVRAERRRRG